MIKRILDRLFGFSKDEGGSAFVLFTIIIPAILALSAIAVDVGYVYYVKTRLQTAADLGALAGASILYTKDATTVKALATQYANLNLPSNWDGKTSTSVTGSSSAKIGCAPTIQTMGLTCQSTSGGNVLQVTVTAVTPLFFASALGYKTVTLSADALVTGGGSSPPPLNVAIVIDMTASMGSALGTKCGTLSSPTRIQCAILAAKSLLSSLWSSLDQVALYAYPTVTANSLKLLTCASGAPSSISTVDYQLSTNPDYQLLDFSTDYRDSGSPPTGGLITSSDLVKALGKAASSATATDSTTCNGLNVSNLGGQGTFYTAAITQAENDLVAANNALIAAGKPARQNVMIILSDGDANVNIDGSSTYNSFYTGTDYYTKWNIEPARQGQQCQTAATATAAPKADGTWVYSVAFGADNTSGNSCFTDRPVTSVIKTTGLPAATVVSQTKPCTPCVDVPLATGVTSTIAAVNGSKQQVVTITTQTTVTSCTSTKCTTTTTPTKIQTDTYDMSKYTTTACATMKALASDASKFYSTNQTTCPSAANPNFTDLVAIFQNVAASIMKKRRIPNNTPFT